MMRINLPALHVPAGDARTMLRRAVMGFAVAAVPCTVALALNDRVLDNGHNVWLKPLRFSVAFGVHLWTLVVARVVDTPARGG